MRKESITEKNISPTIVCTVPWRLIKVKPLENYRLEVEFIDGTYGFVEMEKKIFSQEAGVFSKLRDISTFKKVHLNYGAVTWPGENDVAPDVMYDEIKEKGTWFL